MDKKLHRLVTSILSALSFAAVYIGLNLLFDGATLTSSLLFKSLAMGAVFAVIQRLIAKTQKDGV